MKRPNITARSKRWPHPHDWWDWYAAYIDARERGSNPEEASAAAGRYMVEEKHVVVARA